MKYFAQLHTAVQLVEKYNGQKPFAEFLREYFRLNKKHGSTDRKQIAQICYACFRTAKALQQLPLPERMVAGLLLCSQQPNTLLEHLRPEWNDKAPLPIAEKCALVGAPDAINKIFPWVNALSAGMDASAYALSFLGQPDLFLRCRPGYEKIVKQKLDAAGITFREITPSCLAMSNASKVDQVVVLNKEAVIQDYSSQKTGALIHWISNNRSTPVEAVWDCCAGSGGKSIMACDLLPGIELTVSDIRKSVLGNLEGRFAAAGIRNYRALVADLSAGIPAQLAAAGAQYDLVIADVPCTGSGTWSRTPERLTWFNASEIERFHSLQKKISANAVRLLRPGGYLLYITCSVFRQENEAVVEALTRESGLELRQMELIKGYDVKADSMFAAVLSA